MAAYLVVHVRVTDPARFKAYAAQALPLIEAAGGRRVAIGRPQCLEGSPARWMGSAVYEWPDRATAAAFWQSDVYARAKAMRDGAAEVEAVLIGD